MTTTPDHEEPIEPDLPIIDPHHHLWEKGPFPFLPPYPIESLAQDRTNSGHNIRATVFVDCQTGYLTDGPPEMRVVGETQTIEAQAAAAEAAGGAMAGLATKIVSRADMRLGGAVEKILQAHMAASPTRFRGIRHMAPWHPGKDFFGLDITEGMMRSDAFREGVACLARLGLSFDAWVLFTQLSDVVSLARAVPDATIILDHAGTPMELPSYTQQDIFKVWRKGMAEVASCPNAVVKIGGLLMHHDASRKMDSETAAAEMRDYVLNIIELFSPNRCMFESNFPVDGLQISYGNLWNAFKRVTADFTREEREEMFFGTAARAYQIIL